ncbi:glycoside hydrolase family 15 protein [Streptomyces sp. SID8111]|uniref:glycoside hydrolase family 15 protein n=1 Tax=Streptomyces sp. SID8111 TaxID=2706100 RepID=UPI0013C0B5EE|nr:glycoside hydrolase family 15 protein [Streptomyces sp. SID8111]NEC27525.1 glycoside hydrolase family 15 protein [Streptomyces sp. SID8111]NEC28196.1 glycoside hydrolase family 15 protein [Streptomyces sp. SID8111]
MNRPGTPHDTATAAAPDAPWTLRDYALIADGERGALIDPRGGIAWLCAPAWHDGAVFNGLLGGPGRYRLRPADRWNVWGGYYEDGTLIRVSRWVTAHGIVSCREALAVPADPGRVVLLRQVRAVRGTAVVDVDLDVRADYGESPMTRLRQEGGTWRAHTGSLRVRLTGAADARPGPDGGLHTRLRLPEGGSHDLVLELATETAEPRHAPLDPHDPHDPHALWVATERWWKQAVPDCSDTAAPRDTRMAYAVLNGLTSAAGGMVAAATTSLPERADTGRDYDYRYAWVRDQCYAGIAVATHGPHPLLERAVRFVADRILEDGSRLRPAYTVDGGPLPPERGLPFVGYPGGSDRTGNHAGRQFQLDVFGEALQLFAAAARHDVLDTRAARAAALAARAVADRWTEPDAGLWELESRWWTHSRLCCVVGLRALARELDTPASADWSRLADRILEATRSRCRHPDGHWQRAADDTGPEAALLLPLARGAVPPTDPSFSLTRAQVAQRLARDGYVYRFRHGDEPLGDAEGAFLLCGFTMALAAHVQGRHTEAARWFERTRSACGPTGLFAEEYDVAQRQLRGNLPQGFVHALLLECSARFGTGPDAFPPVGW